MRSVVHFLSIALFLLVNKQANGQVIGMDQHLSLIFLGKCRDPHLCLAIFTTNYFFHVWVQSICLFIYSLVCASFYFSFTHSLTLSLTDSSSQTLSHVLAQPLDFVFFFFFFCQTSNGRWNPPSSSWCKYLCSSRLYRLVLSFLSLYSHKFFENKKAWTASGLILYFWDFLHVFMTQKMHATIILVHFAGLKYR